MSTADERKQALDDALRADIAEQLEEGEIATVWIALVGVRNINGGGSVVTTSSGRADSDGPTDWEIEGLLRRGLAILNDPGGGDE